MVGPFLYDSAWWGDLNVYTSVPPFFPAPAHFLTIGHPSFPPLFFLGRHMGLVGSHLSRRFLVPYSAFLLQDQLPQNWPGSPQLQHADHLVPLRLVGAIGSPTISWRPFCVACRLWTQSFSSRAYLRASFSFFSPHSSSWIFMAESSTSSENALPAFLHM
jgi:hypothetical protein